MSDATRTADLADLAAEAEYLLAEYLRALARLSDAEAESFRAASAEALARAALTARAEAATCAAPEPGGPRCSIRPTVGRSVLYYDGVAPRGYAAKVVAVGHAGPDCPMIPTVSVVVFGYCDRDLSGPLITKLYDYDSPRPDGRTPYCTWMEWTSAQARKAAARA